MIVKVALAVPPTYLLDYSSESRDISLFSRVLVTVGKRKVIGFVVAKDVKIDYDLKKVKPILKVIDKPISKDIQNLIVWLSQYYCCDLYNAIRLALPNDFFKFEEITPQKDVYVYLDTKELENYQPTPKQQDVLKLFVNSESLLLKDLKDIASSYVITKLLDKGILKKVYKLKKSYNVSQLDMPKSLNEEQQYAYQQIISKDGFNVSLLYGVTGSGKTEVYLHVIKQFLAKSQQVLVLVPEINLTPQTIKRFESRFVNKIVVALHSKLSEKARLTNWLKIKNGEADIVIATRSGVLADFKNLGVIIVDEEHDSSYKQQTTTIRYNARDVAIFRAKQLNIPVILGSATPSLQSYYNSLVGRYNLLKLTQRALNSYKNKIHLVDLKATIVDNGISRELFNFLEKNIKAHQQSLIFINKLGYAKALVCKNCGSAVECKKCDKPYTLHIHPYQYLECHFCGVRKSLVIVCPNCNAQELFPYGSGTEKIQARIEAKFPNNKVIRFDRANIKTITDLHAVNQLINDKEVDVIVGTQMIAKGHHFDNITLVGLINIDAGFYSSDFNAVEKTAQLIVQVSGRAGRAENPGQIILQTYQPKNRLLHLLINSDYLDFLNYLLKQREYAGYPPYTYQAQIIAESKNEKNILELLNKIYSSISKNCNIKVSSPLPALHLKKNNIYRYSLLLTANSRKNINKTVNYISQKYANNLSSKVKIYFDIDPIEFL